MAATVAMLVRKTCAKTDISLLLIPQNTIAKMKVNEMYRREMGKSTIYCANEVKTHHNPYDFINVKFKNRRNQITFVEYLPLNCTF